MRKGRSMAEDKLAHWPDKYAAAATLGLSPRSVERLIQQKKIRVKHRPILGRKPLTVLNPEDVERIKAEVLPPVPAPAKAGTALVPHRPVKAADMLAALTPPRVPLDKKLYLTVREASEYAGLPQSYIRRLITGKKLKAIVAAGYRIKRADLERL
jgi:excisionase family DNA binding protein